MDRLTFPAISICLVDGLDSSMLDEYGYDSPYAYFTGLGMSDGIPFFGWSGKLNEDPFVVMNNIMLMGNKSQLLKATFLYQKNDKLERRDVQIEFMRPFFPFGRCLKLIPDKKTKDIAYLLLELNRQIGPDDGRFKIFLTNPSTETQLFAQPSELQGQEIIIDSQYPKNMHTVKTSIYVHEKDDPNYACGEYAEGFTYEECVEKEFTLKIEKALNCTPPWLISTDAQMVCKTNLNVSELPESFMKEMQQIWPGYKPSGSTIPCKTLCYEPAHAFQYESVKVEN